LPRGAWAASYVHSGLAWKWCVGNTLNVASIDVNKAHQHGQTIQEKQPTCGIVVTVVAVGGGGGGARCSGMQYLEAVRVWVAPLFSAFNFKAVSRTIQLLHH